MRRDGTAVPTLLHAAGAKQIRYFAYACGF